jgi:flagellar motility protein MotE (MotC chaperone)
MPIRGTVSETVVVERLNRLEEKLDELSKQLTELKQYVSTEFKQARGEVTSPLYR